MADESKAGEGDEARVLEWEIGLPTADDLTPLSQALIPPDLAAAFSIAPEPTRTMLQVHRASHITVSALRRLSSPSSAAALGSFSPFSSPPPPANDDRPDAPTAAAEAEAEAEVEAEAEAEEEEEEEEEADSARTIKRPRLVWTPPLHKRFVDVVGHLGIKNAVPKTIMQLMNVEGLTRENVASHLQKYRIYLKKLQGVPTECPPSSSSSDHLFASTPLPQDPPLALMPMPAMIPVTVSSHSYGTCAEMQKDWPAARNFASMASYSSVTPSDK